MKGFSFGLGRGAAAKTAGPKVPKPAAPAAFCAPDSEDDEPAGGPSAKRARWDTPAEPSGAATTPAASAPPPGSDAHSVADKLADFVARNGRKFEDVTRERNKPDGPFRFLYEVGSPDHRYYLKKLHEAEHKLAGRASAGPPAPPAPAPPTLPPSAAVPPPPSNAAGALAAATAAASAVAAKLMRGAESPPRERERPSRPEISKEVLAAASQLAAAGDSLAAMEAFAQAAQKGEEARSVQDTREEILNESGFDRRRKVAVYKSDGKRGHHMQDFIPQEELAGLLSASGDKAAQEQAAALEAAAKIKADNVGHKLLSMMGWKEGEGLGASGAGRAAPVQAQGEAGGERRGLGTKSHTAIEEGDDEFDQYRKRMMLGYKHRPNPLGNPRKAYY